jgi:CRP-like cAMP-binding protein
MSESVAFLRRCELLIDLPSEELIDLMAESRTVTLRRGQRIDLGNADHPEVGLVASGRIKLARPCGRTRAAVLMLVEPGQVFGELSLLVAERSELVAEALELSTVVLFPARVLHGLMDRRPRLLRRLTELVARRRLQVESRLGQMLFRSNRERLQSLLLDYVGQYGVPDDRGIQLQIKLSHADIANIVGSTRETVTVILGQMQTEGIIEIARRRIRVLDVDRLALVENNGHATSMK